MRCLEDAWATIMLLARDHTVSTWREGVSTFTRWHVSTLARQSVAHHLLLITHCSLLVAHHSLLITHCSLLVAHCSLPFFSFGTRIVVCIVIIIVRAISA
jgi:hypothetical protein